MAMTTDAAVAERHGRVMTASLPSPPFGAGECGTLASPAPSLNCTDGAARGLAVGIDEAAADLSHTFESANFPGLFNHLVSAQRFLTCADPISMVRAASRAAEPVAISLR
jgi:hypothetical protein